MTENYDETLRAAREMGETQLDDILAMMRVELGDVPTEHRFEFMLSRVSQLPVDPFVAWVGYTVALERLLTMEGLERDLAPPPAE